MYGEILYIKRGVAMTAERTVSLSFRVSPRFARLLETAAALDHRSKTNLIETLVLQFCQVWCYADQSSSPAPRGLTVEQHQCPGSVSQAGGTLRASEAMVPKEARRSVAASAVPRWSYGQAPTGHETAPGTA
jgi:hypothetical protein